jgi:PilZ domain
MELATQTNTSTPFGQTMERRHEIRIPTDVRARLKSLDPVTSLGPSTVAQIIEVSDHGLKVRVDRPLTIGASVQILAAGRIVLGRVRHCLSLDTDYHIGIQVVELGT